MGRADLHSLILTYIQTGVTFIQGQQAQVLRCKVCAHTLTPGCTFTSMINHIVDCHLIRQQQAHFADLMAAREAREIEYNLERAKIKTVFPSQGHYQQKAQEALERWKEKRKVWGFEG